MTRLPFDIEFALTLEDDGWQALVSDLEACARDVILATLAALPEMQDMSCGDVQIRPVVEISLLLTADAHIQELNEAYRQKEGPTNVLSFPDTLINETSLEEAALTGEPVILGDVIMALETVRSEAEVQKKDPTDHFRHLLAHGVLHLAGHDHIDENEAQIMEQLEIKILQGMGVANPYEVPDEQLKEPPLTR